MRDALQIHAWAADTAANPATWTPQHPSTGQCAVTALAVQDRFGGELLRVTVPGDSHYFNRLADGQVIDLTRDQFERCEPTGPPEVRAREYLLSTLGPPRATQH